MPPPVYLQRKRPKSFSIGLLEDYWEAIDMECEKYDNDNSGVIPADKFFYIFDKFGLPKELAERVMTGGCFISKSGDWFNYKQCLKEHVQILRKREIIRDIDERRRLTNPAPRKYPSLMSRARAKMIYGINRERQRRMKCVAHGNGPEATELRRKRTEALEREARKEMAARDYVKRKAIELEQSKATKPKRKPAKAKAKRKPAKAKAKRKPAKAKAKRKPSKAQVKRKLSKPVVTQRHSTPKLNRKRARRNLTQAQSDKTVWPLPREKTERKRLKKINGEHSEKEIRNGRDCGHEECESCSPSKFEREIADQELEKDSDDEYLELSKEKMKRKHSDEDEDCDGCSPEKIAREIENEKEQLTKKTKRKPSYKDSEECPTEKSSRDISEEKVKPKQNKSKKGDQKQQKNKIQKPRICKHNIVNHGSCTSSMSSSASASSRHADEDDVKEPTESDDSEFVCKSCGKDCKSKIALYAHQQKCCQEKAEEMEVFTEATVENQTDFTSNNPEDEDEEENMEESTEPDKEESMEDSDDDDDDDGSEDSVIEEENNSWNEESADSSSMEDNQCSTAVTT